MKKIIKYLFIAVIIAAVLYLAYWFLTRDKKEEKTVFRTENVTVGDVARTISATGTVEPEELVNVGAQVNGKIMSFGKDNDGKTVDFGSKVSAGMVLAQIDDVTYKAELQQAEAEKAQALASIASAEAAIKEAEANEVLAKHNYDRAEILLKQKSMTQSDYDSYQAEYLTAIARVAKAKASLAQANASLQVAEAALIKAKRNLEYCVITSPVDGIIIDRRVSVGQTVVSNQTASSIFLVAKDFSKMQVWASVNEADIGAVKDGMEVEFSCDAFPGETFNGVVFRKRLNATLSSNVVTYIVEINADNSKKKLLPYLTANVRFIRAREKDALCISNSALRFRPGAEYIDPAFPVPETGRGEAVIYKISENGKLRPVKVKVLLSSGVTVAVAPAEGEDLEEGDKIVNSVEKVTEEEPEEEATGNFLTGNMPKRSGRGSAGRRERLEQRQQQSGGQQTSTAVGK